MPKIFKAWVYIRNDLSPTKKRTCIVEEVSRAIGINNDLPGLPSIFSDDMRSSTPTETDRAIIRALYDEDLRSGMRRNQALTAVGAWFAEDRAGTEPQP